MGNLMVRSTETFLNPDENPIPYGPTTFDPHLGFRGEREERVMIATEQELRAAMIPKEQWDFCAHHLLELYRCKADNWPFIWRCKEQSHTMSMCNLDDWVIRMKEYERERRLLQRAKRAEQAAAA